MWQSYESNHLMYNHPTKEKSLPDEKIEEVKNDLILLYDPRSMCYGDGYYANSLVRKYGMSIAELESIVGKPKLIITWEWN